MNIVNVLVNMRRSETLRGERHHCLSTAPSSTFYKMYSSEHIGFLHVSNNLCYTHLLVVSVLLLFGLRPPYCGILYRLISSMFFH